MEALLPGVDSSLSADVSHSAELDRLCKGGREPLTGSRDSGFCVRESGE